MKERRSLLILLALIVGATIGGGTVAFASKWGPACAVDGGLIWTAIGAIGSAGAAIGAVYAAQVAIRVALVPIQATEDVRLDRARLIAESLSEELNQAAQNARDAADVVRNLRKESRRNLVEGVGPLAYRSTTTIEKSLGDLEIFGRDLGATVARACTSVLNLNRALEDMSRWPPRDGDDRLTEYEDNRVIALCSLADETVELADTARTVVGSLIVVSQTRFDPHSVSLVTENGRTRIEIIRPHIGPK